MGENAEYFYINGQRADFENINGHYMQLPHSLALGEEWSFMLTANQMPVGQHSVGLALWTTQGRPQHPFNGTILGDTSLFFSVENGGTDEEEVKISDKEMGKGDDEDSSKEINKQEDGSELEGNYNGKPHLPEKLPEAPEAEIPEEIPQLSRPSNRVENNDDTSYPSIAISEEGRQFMAQNQEQDMPQIVHQPVQTTNIAALEEIQAPSLPQDSPPLLAISPLLPDADKIIAENEPPKEYNEAKNVMEIPLEPSLSPPQNILTANPQTSDSSGRATSLLFSSVSFLLFAAIITASHKRV